MSADRWTRCPRCIERDLKNKAEQQRKADEAYGKVPVKEFYRLRDEAAKPLSDEENFREDFWVGINDKEKTVEVDYRGHCQDCGFAVTLKHIKALKLHEPESKHGL